MKYKEFYPFELTQATKKTDNLMEWLQVAHQLAPLIKQVSPLLQQFTMLASLLPGNLFPDTAGTKKYTLS